MRKRNPDIILDRLEKKYDTKAAPTREYFTDYRDIQLLVKEGLIDRDHADILIEGAAKRRKDAEAARKPKRVTTPIGAALVRKKPYTGTSGAITNTFDAINTLIHALIGMAAILFLAVVIF